MVNPSGLSFASLVIETFIARYFLGERVGFPRWAGAGLVAVGVWLLAV